MKLSATTTAFLVLLAAFVVVGIYAQTRDLDTDVSTVEETLLPLTYTGEDLREVKGFSLRYPRGWEVRGQDGDVVLSRPVDEEDPSAGQVTVNMVIDQQGADRTLEPVDMLGNLLQNAGEITPLEPTSGKLPAARTVTVAQEMVVFAQLVRLTDDNYYVLATNAEPVPQSVWDEVDDELFRTLDSIAVTPDFRILPNALTYTTPEGWQVIDSNQVGFVASPLGEDGLPRQDIYMEVRIMSAEQLLTNPPLILPEGTVPADITDPMALMDLAAQVEDPAVEFTEELTDASYAGLQGKVLQLTVEGLGDYRIFVLDAHDGYYLLGRVLDQTGSYATIAETVEQIFSSVTYTTPDASFFEAPVQP